MSGYTYGTGVLIAAERGDRAAWALHRRALERHRAPTVPANVLAQAWRSGPQPMLSRLLAGCRIEPLDASTARETGRACAAAKTSDVVDASVVVVAARRNDTVVTTDAGDLRRLTAALRSSIRVVSLSIELRFESH